MEGAPKGNRIVIEGHKQDRATPLQVVTSRVAAGHSFPYYDDIFVTEAGGGEQGALVAALRRDGFSCVCGDGESSLHLMENNRHLNVMVWGIDECDVARCVLQRYGAVRDFAFIVLGDKQQAGALDCRLLHFTGTPLNMPEVVRHAHRVCYELEVLRRLRERTHLEEAFQRFSRDFVSRLDVTDCNNDTLVGGHGMNGIHGMLGGSRLRALSLSRRVLRAKPSVGGQEIGNVCLLILLELYDAQLAQRTMKVTALCYGARLPQTTALRHIDELVATGLVERQQDESDKRRVFLSLSPQGRREVDNFLDNLIE